MSVTTQGREVSGPRQLCYHSSPRSTSPALRGASWTVPWPLQEFEVEKASMTDNAAIHYSLTLQELRRDP